MSGSERLQRVEGCGVILRRGEGGDVSYARTALHGAGGSYPSVDKRERRRGYARNRGGRGAAHERAQDGGEMRLHGVFRKTASRLTQLRRRKVLGEGK